MAKVRECLETGKIAFEPHFARERQNRGIGVIEIRDALSSPNARIGMRESDIRYLERRNAWAYRIESRCKGWSLVVVVTFYLPEDAEEPDTVSIITAFCPETEDGHLPRT